MAATQHTYRRKHTYWYRRVLTLFGRSPVDVRLSLRTSDRREAQHRAATLTAATGEVLRMIEVELKAPDGRPTEAELRAMARRMYEVVLAETMDKQRETPELPAAHRASNRAHIDYYDHVVRTGGRPQVSAVDIQSFAALGWSAERLDRLELLANAYAVQPAIATRTIDALLREHGYRSAEPLRRIVSLDAKAANWRIIRRGWQAKPGEAVPVADLWPNHDRWRAKATSSIRHRSVKCACAACRSPSSRPRQRWMNSAGVTQLG